MAVNIILIVLCVLSAIAFIIVRNKVGGAWALITKIIASMSFVGLGMRALTQNGAVASNTLIVCGLICGLIGDILLDLKVMYASQDKIYLNAGTIAFMVGHILYFIGFTLWAKTMISVVLAFVISFVVGIIMGALITFGSKKLGINLKGFKVQSFLYASLLSFMCVYTTYISIAGLKSIFMALGMWYFLISDIVLSFEYFGNKNTKSLVTINHTLYYIAQIFIACFILFI